MRLISYLADGTERLGIDMSGQVVAATDLLPDGPTTMGDVLADPDVLDRLREALAASVHARLSERAVAARDVRAVNLAAATPVPTARLRAEAGWLGRRDPVLSVAEILSVIARDAIELLTGPQLPLLRECEGSDCTGVFVDASRARRRRWCSTARCGNRARVAAHRSRRGPGGRSDD